MNGNLKIIKKSMQFIKKLNTIEFVILIISIICFFTLCFKVFASEYYLYPQSSYSYTSPSGVSLEWKFLKLGDYTMTISTGINYSNAQTFCSSNFGSDWRLPSLDEAYSKFVSGSTYEKYFYKNEYSHNIYQWLLDDNPYRVSTTTAPAFNLNYSNGVMNLTFPTKTTSSYNIVGACVKETISEGGGEVIIASSNDSVTIQDMGSTTNVINGFTYGEIMLITLSIILCFIGIYISLKITLK